MLENCEHPVPVDRRGSMVLGVRVDRETYDGYKTCVETDGQTVSGSIRDAIESVLERTRIETAKRQAAAEKKAAEWPWWWGLVGTLVVIGLAKYLESIDKTKSPAALAGYGHATDAISVDYLRRQATAGSGSDDRAVSDGAPDAPVAT
ncbi:unnamed protein product [marine sediment metagenome]|uniref:Uncharacterized protein n=1 Tax=marine sediment metagenome TaxID=412755 RepID=X1RML5_9ZZZZ